MWRPTTSLGTIKSSEKGSEGPVAVFALILPTFVVAQGQPAKMVQIAAVIETEITPTVSVPGTIFSRNDVQITAGVAGQLERVAEPGTVIEKGQVVASIDSTALLLQCAEQEALLERAEISLANERNY